MFHFNFIIHSNWTANKFNQQHTSTTFVIQIMCVRTCEIGTPTKAGMYCVLSIRRSCASNLCIITNTLGWMDWIRMSKCYFDARQKLNNLNIYMNYDMVQQMFSPPCSTIPLAILLYGKHTHTRSFTYNQCVEYILNNAYSEGIEMSMLAQHRAFASTNCLNIIHSEKKFR